MNTPQDLLPIEISRHINRATNVEQGSHLTFRCEFDDNQIKYLKATKSPQQLPELQLEARVTAFLTGTVSTKLNIAKVLWMSAEGDKALFSEVPGEEVTRVGLIENLSTLLLGLVNLHHIDVKDRIQLPTWSWADLVRAINATPIENQLKYRLDQRLAKIDNTVILSPQHLAMVHGDLNKGNVLFESQTKYWGLLDWECACYNDVRWDLASLAVEYELSDAQITELFEQYANLSKIEVDQFLTSRASWIQFYKLTCLVWAINHDYPTRLYL